MAKVALTIPAFVVSLDRETLRLLQREEDRVLLEHFTEVVIRHLEPHLATILEQNKRVCKVCQKRFFGRSDSFFCTGACKMKDYRRRTPGYDQNRARKKAARS